MLGLFRDSKTENFLLDKYSNIKIADKYKVTKGTIYQINRGTNFKREKDIYPLRGKKENINEW